MKTTKPVAARRTGAYHWVQQSTRPENTTTSSYCEGHPSIHMCQRDMHKLSSQQHPVTNTSNTRFIHTQQKYKCFMHWSTTKLRQREICQNVRRPQGLEIVGIIPYGCINSVHGLRIAIPERYSKYEQSCSISTQAFVATVLKCFILWKRLQHCLAHTVLMRSSSIPRNINKHRACQSLLELYTDCYSFVLSYIPLTHDQLPQEKTRQNVQVHAHIRLLVTLMLMPIVIL